jgi:hypothetical protein
MFIIGKGQQFDQGIGEIANLGTQKSEVEQSEERRIF